LLRDGVVSIPVLRGGVLVEMHRLMDDSIAKFPEYKDPAHTARLVQGGFAALGNCSSFHNPFARTARSAWHWVATAFFRQLQLVMDESNLSTVPTDSDMNDGKSDAKSITGSSGGGGGGGAGRVSTNLRLEQLVDRILWRDPNQTPSAESAHRDESPCQPGDMVFGGWLNCNLTQSHHFSCVPTSQKPPALAGATTGFTKLTKAESKVYQSQMKSIECLPGEWIVFYQNLVHCVNPTKLKFRAKRLFAGWRLTTHVKPLFADQRLVMIDQVKTRAKPELNPTRKKPDLNPTRPDLDL